MVGAGQGFPPAKKWEMATTYPPPRVLVCNADESEPGTFKDRFLLRHRPWLVLEGMVLAGYAVGADRGDALSSFRLRLPSAWLGGSACTDDDGRRAGGREHRRLRVFLSASTFTSAPARISAARNRRCWNRSRASGASRDCGRRFPWRSGLHGRPTVVDNVETLAYIPRILDTWRRLVPGSGHRGIAGHEAVFALRRRGLSRRLRTAAGYALRAVDRRAGRRNARRFRFCLGGRRRRPRLRRAIGWTAPLDFEHQLGNGSVMVFHAGRAPLEIGGQSAALFQPGNVRRLPSLPRRRARKPVALLESASRQGLTAKQRESFDLLAECLETTSRCGLGKTALKAAKDLLQLTRGREPNH